MPPQLSGWVCNVISRDVSCCTAAACWQQTSFTVVFLALQIIFTVMVFSRYTEQLIASSLRLNHHFGYLFISHAVQNAQSLSSCFKSKCVVCWLSSWAKTEEQLLLRSVRMSEQGEIRCKNTDTDLRGCGNPWSGQMSCPSQCSPHVDRSVGG